MKKYHSLHDSHSTKMCMEYPSECPICHSSISPDYKFDFYNDTIDHVTLFFSCPSCGKGFISHYGVTDDTERYAGYEYAEIILETSYPNIPLKHQFEKCIENLSTSFCEIYNQALASENYKLNQISGIGYRKALEFLIKDYAIYRHPDKTDEIKSKLLGQVINDYIDSSKLKSLSKASVWIGNDETHYIRKFENKDITDLKRFISATVAFITYELTSDEAEDLILSR